MNSISQILFFSTLTLNMQTDEAKDRKTIIKKW